MFSVKDFFSQFWKILCFLRFCSYLLNQSLAEISFFCAVTVIIVGATSTCEFAPKIKTIVKNVWLTKNTWPIYKSIVLVIALQVQNLRDFGLFHVPIQT